MKTLRTLLFSLTVGLLADTSASAQPKKRVSPHDTISQVIGEKGNSSRVIVVYGRPYTKDPSTGEPRTIWGGKLVPAGKVWRVGADEATLLITEKPILLGNTEVPAGAHTLFLEYNEGGNAKLIVSNAVGEWGTQYDETKDFARVPMTKAVAETETTQFTMAITQSGKTGTLTLMWGDTQYSVSIAIAGAKSS